MSKVPSSTYRLQMHAGFTLDDVAAQISYLAELGISHLYASPYLQAAPGSTHGYDVMDPTRINRELGGEQAHRRLIEALTAHGLGQVLDIVPNHMAISGPENVWWWDVLESGPASPYATYFDVEWDSGEGRLGNKILLPILGDQYGRILEKREIKISREGAAFTLHYHEHKLPVAPDSAALLLDRAAQTTGSDFLGFVADVLSDLPSRSALDWDNRKRRHRDIQVVTTQLSDRLATHPDTAAAIDTVINEINADPDLLHELIERQHYRVAFWKTASRDLSYRRFFDINTLVGVHVEDERVLADTHVLIFQWLRDGTLDGVRVDHPDGLRDPEQYFSRLRATAPDTWIVAEKILHPGEQIPITWPVAGTTGYDFMNILQNVFIDQESKEQLSAFYEEFTGESTDWALVAREKKHQVMHLLMGSDINRLTELLLNVCERHRRYRDYTRFELNEGLRELIACFPVYRTYIRAGEEQIRTEDRRFITEAITKAIELRPELDPEMFNFIRGLLLKEYRGDLETEFIMRFQQSAGPITAKGIEDTAFYNYNRFVALNEVGGDPSRFGLTIEAFHQCMAERASRQPQSMLASSTHDTKRSEDVRARLAVLSEIPQAWIDVVRRWSARNEQYRINNCPDRNAEYLLYQTLVGAWPIEEDRTLAYMEKACREAKSHTSWMAPKAAYETAVRDFVSDLFDDSEFCADLEQFVASIQYAGKINSLSQTLIKLIAPGIPDIYQGTELWDLSLVDPDNRRPVDFDHRRRLLHEVQSATPEDIMSRMDEGLPKLFVTQRALAVRRRFNNVLSSSSYQPILARGDKASHALAFSRGDHIATIVPRLPLSLQGAWGDTSIELPSGTWRNQFTSEEYTGTMELQLLLQRFPVALLVKE